MRDYECSTINTFMNSVAIFCLLYSHNNIVPMDIGSADDFFWTPAGMDRYENEIKSSLTQSSTQAHISECHHDKYGRRSATRVFSIGFNIKMGTLALDLKVSD
jgi:hypothetical protein